MLIIIDLHSIKTSCRVPIPGSHRGLIIVYLCMIYRMTSTQIKQNSYKYAVLFIVTIRMFLKLVLLMSSTAVNAAHINAKIESDELKSKLKRYQSDTGISDAQKDEIWNMFSIISVLQAQNRNAQSEPVMARYGMSQELEGIVSPVIMDHEFFNLNMIYNAGKFIIMEPGYYRLTLQCYHNQTGFANKWA